MLLHPNEPVSNAPKLDLDGGEGDPSIYPKYAIVTNVSNGEVTKTLCVGEVAQEAFYFAFPEPSAITSIEFYHERAVATEVLTNWIKDSSHEAT